MIPHSFALHRTQCNRNWLWFVALVLALGTGLQANAQTVGATPRYQWTTLAGRPTTGFADGPAAEALFNNPRGIAVDLDDNIYVADTANHVIRKITPQGMVTTLAGSPGIPGSADGIGSDARFAFPKGVAVDEAGNVYIADTENHTLRKISPEGEVTTLAGKPGETGDGTGPLESLRFNHPHQFFSDKSGNIYFGTTDSFRQITTAGVEDISLDLADPVFYENGQPSESVSAWITAVDWDGNFYLQAGIGSTTNGANPGSPKIRRIIKLSTDGSYSILATTEYGTGQPYLSDSVSVIRWANDSFGNVYYVTRLISSVIVYQVYRIAPDGSVTAASWQSAGRGGYADEPISLTADSEGHILHFASPDDVIYKTGNQLEVIAGTLWSNGNVDGIGPVARFANISDLTVNDEGQVIVGDSLSTYQTKYYASAAVRKITTTGLTSTVYTRASSEGQGWVPAHVAVDADNAIYLGSANYGIPNLIKISSTGLISVISTGIIRTMGPLSVTQEGQIIVAEPTRIVRRSVSGDWSVLAGTDTLSEIKDGLGAEARFYRITDFTVAPNGDFYALDDASGASEAKVLIRKIAPNQHVSTVSNNLIRENGSKPSGLALNAHGDFVLTYTDDTIRLLTIDGSLQVIGGQPGASGTSDGLGNQARFYQPIEITTDADNNLYVADNAGTTVRKGEFLGYNATITSHPQHLTVVVGATAKFSVTARGTPAPTYQWLRNGSPINSATESTLTLANARTTDAGDYSVVVTNALGSVTSNIAKLTVTAAPTPSAPSRSSGGGGGGAPSVWSIGLLGLAALSRTIRYWRCKTSTNQS